MGRKVVVASLVWLALGGMGSSVEAAAVQPLEVPREARVMVFAPHPDDETIAAGGLLARLAARRTPLRVVFVTNGDGYLEAFERDRPAGRPSHADFVAYGVRRQREAETAARRLGLERRTLAFLGFPDGGLAALWDAHWARPYTSPYTNEERPPYPDTVDPRAEYEGEDLTSVISRLLRAFRPTIVVLPHPLDRHPDHSATSFFVIEAASRLVAHGVLPTVPELLGYLVHYPSWPATRPPTFDRVSPVSTLGAGGWVDGELSAPERDAKRAALEEYATQLGVMNGFLRHFLGRNELFVTIDPVLRGRIAAVH